jgi:two-component sensor histidine kinase
METDQKQREEQVRLLLREVNHRSKNMLAVVQSIARHSMRSNPQTFIGDFEKRLQALATSQDLVVNNDWKGVLLEDVVRTQLAHVANRRGDRIAIDGERVMIAPAAAQSLSMAVHELVTNAFKYGALSTPAGSVRVSWEFLQSDAGKQFQFAWVEQGGPAAERPVRRGFGTTVLETVTARALGASAVLDYRREGLVWRLNCPADRIAWRSE